jgi:hypothetical protein
MTFDGFRKISDRVLAVGHFWISATLTAIAS